MNNELLKSIVVYGGIPVAIGLGISYVAVQAGIPFWVFLALIAVAVGVICYVCNQYEKKGQAQPATAEHALAAIEQALAAKEQALAAKEQALREAQEILAGRKR